MSIQKKSLISTLKTTKKANVAKESVASPDVHGTTQASLRPGPGIMAGSMRGTLKGSLKAHQKGTLKGSLKGSLRAHQKGTLKGTLKGSLKNHVS